MNEAHENAQAERPVREYSAWLVGLLGGLATGLPGLLLLAAAQESPEWVIPAGLVVLVVVSTGWAGLICLHWMRILGTVSPSRWVPRKPLALAVGTLVVVLSRSWLEIVCIGLLLALLWQAMAKKATRLDKCALAFLLAMPGLGMATLGLLYLSVTNETAVKDIFLFLELFLLVYGVSFYGVSQYLFNRGLRIRREQGELPPSRSLGSILADFAAGAGISLLVGLGLVLAVCGLTARG